MAKRFTDTAKWEKEWYRKLGSKLRDVRSYVLDKCDTAGIFEIDLDRIAFFIGEEVTLKDIGLAFRGEITSVDDNKIFIPAFFHFQYSNTKDGFKAKVAAIKRLQALGLMDETGTLLEVFPNTKDTPMEHLPKCPSISIIKSKSIINTGDAAKFENRFKYDYEELFNLYPRQQKKSKSLGLMAETWNTDELYAQARQAICRYRDHCEADDLEQKHILTFPNFLLEWTDWLDPNAGNMKLASGGVCGVLDV